MSSASSSSVLPPNRDKYAEDSQRARDHGLFSGQIAEGGPAGYGIPAGVDRSVSSGAVGPSSVAGIGAGRYSGRVGPAYGQPVNYGVGPAVDGVVPVGGVGVGAVPAVAAMPMMAAPVGPAVNDIGTTIFLRPLAPPFALGLMAYWGAAWIFYPWMAGWYGGPISYFWFWPYLFIFGGVAQFVCALYSFWARDALATVFLGLWGSTWLIFSIFFLTVSIGLVPVEDIYGGHQPEFAFQWITIFSITIIIMLCALSRDLVLFLVNAFAALAALLLFIGWFVHAVGVTRTGAYFGIFSGFFAFYRGTAYLVWENFGPFLPVFRSPITLASPAVKIPYGEPGVKHGN